MKNKKVQSSTFIMQIINPAWRSFLLYKVRSGVILGALAIGLFFCAYMEDTKASVNYEFVRDGSGYKVRFSNGKQTWKTVAGTLGVRLGYDKISEVSDLEYVDYMEYSSTEGGHKATATIQTKDGSRIRVTDYFTARKSGVEIVREMEVLEAGSALGFMTIYPIRCEMTGKAEDRFWFAPSAFYGKETFSFSGRGVKNYFDGTESVSPIDAIGVPVIMNYHDGNAFSLLDITEGHRETVVDDMYANRNIVLISKDINLPGIGIKNIQSDDLTNIEMYHAYPSNTVRFSRNNNTTMWRMMPIEKGFKRSCAFIVSMDSYDNFDAAVTGTWEQSFYAYSVIDKRYAKNDVYLALIDNIQRTFGYQTFRTYKDAPQYMAKSDHPHLTSGFLYRNTDLAALMIAAGFRLGRQDYIDTAVEVMEYQVKYDVIDGNAPFMHERAQIEGVMGVIEGYIYAKENGLDKPHWRDYFLARGETKLAINDDMVVPLLLKIYDFTKDKRYLDRSIELMALNEDLHSKYGYQSGALSQSSPTNRNIGSTNREAASVFLNCYADLYRHTGDKKYLEQAKRAATYFESTHIAQPINFLAVGTTGYEYRDDDPSVSTGKRFKEMGYIGNAKIMPYGLSYIVSGSVGVDMFGAYSIPDYYKMSKFLGRSHYDYFLDYLQYNTALYINMGDKHWLMDDFRFSSGMGFMNEYIGAAASTDPVSAGRGTMHISNLAWNMYVLLHSFEEMIRVILIISLMTLTGILT